jgi:hypothetical protein
MLLALLWAMATHGLAEPSPITFDLSQYNPSCGVEIRREGNILKATWPADQSGQASCTLELSLATGSPLIAALGINGKVLATNLQPQYFLTTGARLQRPGVKYIFFDNPSTGKNGPVRHYSSALKLNRVRIESAGQRVTLSLGSLSAGPFAGDFNFHLYSGSPLVHVEAAMAPNTNGLAYIYDAVLEGGFPRFAWKNLSNDFERLKPTSSLGPIAVRNRTIMAETGNGTLAIFPAPHAFFFPRDYSVNYRFAQAGSNCFGLRQDPVGGPGHEGLYIPWFDAPEGKPQRMGMFILLSTNAAEATLEQVKKYTHGDTYKPMDGRITFASHMHSQLTVHEDTPQPRAAIFKKVFQGMNVQAFQLAEFHGDGHPNDPGEIRLRELNGMFDLCRKYSDDKFLMLPSEEANAYFPGHSVLLFPKPIYLTLVPVRAPYSGDQWAFGDIYHPQHVEELARLLREEHGLAWTSHPRIKGSEGCPDKFKEADWYKDPLWLGGTWKAMPADLSEPRLGVRSLDLLDDMNLWGQRKMILAEVDCFTIDETHEIYGHMNINYLHLDKLPPKDDWSPILDVLRRGDFFVTTGEVLLHSCTLTKGKVRADVEWTLPLAHAEVITSDGKAARRQTIRLPGTREFGRQVFEWEVKQPNLAWFRVEVWDIADDGAFTQPSYVQELQER